MKPFSWHFIRVWQRNRDVFFRLWHSEAPGVIAEPIIILLAMGLGLGAYVGMVDGQKYIEFIAPGIIASYAMFSASFECTYGSFVRMEFQKTYDAILATPLSVEDVIAGEIFWGATRSLMTGTVILAIAAAFQLVHSPWAVLIPPLCFLEGIMFASISAGQAVYRSIFHSISGFCNAGFSLFSTSFMGYRGDLYINLVMTTLILLGGIGFIVLLDIPKLKFWRKDRAVIFARLSLQTKLVLVLTVCLVVAGGIFLLFSENANALKGMPLKEKALASYFQAITSRTAGFNTLNIGSLTVPSLLFLMVLMFIGASPGSTGGGIKTATFGIAVATCVAMSKNKDRVTLFKRTIPRHVVRRALLVCVMGLAWVLCFTLLLAVAERAKSDQPQFFLRVLFEVTSAFGTVGLSTGITPTLTSFGKLLIALTMFAGRIGPLTLALAVALREERLIYRYPEERIMVG